MPKRKKIRVIIDTNLLISFLIGLRLKWLKALIVNSSIELLFTDQSFQELSEVASRPKFKKYFPEDTTKELIVFLKTIGKRIVINEIPDICRDQKDNYLLELARKGDADFLITGDKDLLEICTYFKTSILNAIEFEGLVELML